MGGAASFREFAGSAGTTSDILALDLTTGASFRVTDKLSVGAAFLLSFAMSDLALVQASGATNDYAVGGTFGLNYELPMESSIGAYYRTRLRYTFDNQFSIDPPGRERPTIFRDISMDRPAVVGLGLANRSLMDGNLLIAVDAMYILWQDARLLSDMYKNQWVIAVGGQYTMNRLALRAGYAFNTQIMRPDVGFEAGGFTIGTAAVQYFQATQAPAISQHRITVGAGLKDVLPNIDVDFYLGGQIRAAQDFGEHTQGSYLAWFTGFGLTWHFGCEPKN
jgi:long-chain fatty acid transport protein